MHVIPRRPGSIRLNPLVAHRIEDNCGRVVIALTNNSLRPEDIFGEFQERETVGRTESSVVWADGGFFATLSRDKIDYTPHVAILDEFGPPSSSTLVSIPLDAYTRQLPIRSRYVSR